MSPKVPTKECQPPFRGLGTQSENAPLQSKWEELKTEIWGRENTWKGPLGIVLLQEWLNVVISDRSLWREPSRTATSCSDESVDKAG